MICTIRKSWGKNLKNLKSLHLTTQKNIFMDIATEIGFLNWDYIAYF